MNYPSKINKFNQINGLCIKGGEFGGTEQYAH